MEGLELHWAEKHELSAVREFYLRQNYSNPISESDTILLAIIAGEVVAAVRLVSEQGFLVLRGMCVDGPWQRKGVGTFLLRGLQNDMERECFCVSLPHLDSFYKSAKFESVDDEEVPPFLVSRRAQYVDRGMPSVILKRPEIQRPNRQALESVLRLWGETAFPVFIRKVENFVYEILGKNKILRLTQETHRSKAEVEAELQWMAHLAADNIPLANPVKSENDVYVESVSCLSGETCFAVIFERAEGVPVHDVVRIDPLSLVTLGQKIGMMHDSTRSFPLTPNRKNWKTDDSFLMASECAEPDDGLAYDVFGRAVDWMNQLPVTPDCYGLVHADIHPGNYFVSPSGRITLFDFDDCQYHWFSYDLSVPLFSLFLMSVEKEIEFDLHSHLQRLVEGYSSAFVVSPEWGERIPLFYYYRMALMYFWCKARRIKKDMEPDGLLAAGKLMGVCESGLKSCPQFV